ncbi:MAG: hypothetical protein L0241_00800 [Planctomycetia bacterium]|nr:hypothetical protein [Planctomycetia bacterium]
MFRVPRLFVLLAASVSAGSGCAALAKRPPTPAAEISPSEAMSIQAPPGERYFLIIFGSQSTPKQPRYTHVWSTMVKVTGCDGPGAPIIEEQTISWMPATLDIHAWQFRVEPGVNLPLHFTIEEMYRNDERIAYWGPYEVGPGLHHRFSVQKAFMDSGAIGYQCIDNIGESARKGNGCDCIHAVSDMDPQYARERYPLSYFGEAAARHIVRQIHTRPVIINPENDHDWLLPLLGLDQYPLIRRQYFGRTIPNTPENVERYLRQVESGRRTPLR